MDSERLTGWKGIVTGADADVIPPEASPHGANAVITHVTGGTGAVRRRKGAVGDGNVSGNPVILGIFDYVATTGRQFLVVAADGSLYRGV